ncbi:hypothetical protein [Chromobacterium subtsugae]|uniref:hypothetical protein n=1 Tax=Chromobacterium subtsugae TaxID=251747 RepID=UPI0006414D80|nr:hypothetical protein [Chromobacterium subtsugae]
MTIHPADGYPHTSKHYAYSAGDRARQCFQFVRDIDAAMRANYSANIEAIGRNIYPILFAESTFDGGRYTLVVNPDIRHVKENVCPIYDQCKAISHIPLGIYSILSAYQCDSTLQQWAPALAAYHDQIQHVHDHLDELEWPDAGIRQANREILHASLHFIRHTLERGRYDMEEFSHYSRKLTAQIVLNQTTAAQNQVRVMSDTLREWKAMLGDRWRDLYVVVSALWTLSQESAHEEIIGAFMDEDRRETHMIVSETPHSVDDAQALLGRIVGDRIMAEMVFSPHGTETEKENIYSLSTKRDLLSQAIEKAIAEGAGGTAFCPHLSR